MSSQQRSPEAGSEVGTGGPPVPTLEAVVNADRLSGRIDSNPGQDIGLPGRDISLSGRTHSLSGRAHGLLGLPANLPRRLVCGLVRLYQITLGPALPAIAGPGCGCRFTPSCSHYALEAVRTHGALSGSWLAVRRVARCTPLCTGGFDPVPAFKGRVCSRTGGPPVPTSKRRLEMFP